MPHLQRIVQDSLMSDEERQAYHDSIKADSYMRRLAFYYLGRREHSKHELRQKLLAKGCDASKVEDLLIEFEQEGYQSDVRMTLTVIKAGIAKKHGKMRIHQTLKSHHLTTISSVSDITAWIDAHADFFAELMTDDSDDTAHYEVDWLTQAVAARVKKYGDAIPTDPKQKAKQLRFLQYRGYETGVCFEALKHNLETLDNR